MDSSRDIVKRLRENRILAERQNYENYSRDELIKMAQGGDQLAIETLVNTHQGFINNMSKKYFLSTGDKDDVKQIATIAFWDAIQSWNGSGDFEAYAGMIIKRKLTDEIRKEEAGKSQINTGADSLDRSVADDGEGGELSLGATMSSKSLSPEEEYLGRDGARKIMKFMKEELSETERRVIMRYIEGYKVSEISEEENMKYKTVENAIMRVKNKLADYMRNVRESRQLRLSEASIFSDEEKQILKSVIGKIDSPDTMVESKDLEDYTDDEIENELDEMESRVNEIIDSIMETDSEEEYEELLDELKDMKEKIYDFEDVLESDDTSYLFRKCKSLFKLVSSALRTDASNMPSRDHYAEIGIDRNEY